MRICPFSRSSGLKPHLKKNASHVYCRKYLEKVYAAENWSPHVALGTDIIVGFPTETEEEFQLTYDILKEIEYAVAFLFAYSPRKGTPAMRWKDDIPEEVKQERLQRLINCKTKSTQNRDN